MLIFPNDPASDGEDLVMLKICLADVVCKEWFAGSCVVADHS